MLESRLRTAFASATIEDFPRGCENPRFAVRCQSTDSQAIFTKVGSNMGTSRQITESQLERAKAELAVRVKALQEKGLDAKAYKNDPHWRMLDAHVRQISMRLRKIAEVEATNADVAKHKAERLARIAAEKAEMKAGTAGKKAKPEKAKEAKGKKEKAPKEPKEKVAAAATAAPAAPAKEKAPREKKEKEKEKKPE